MATTEHRLGELLVASGLISTSELERALRMQAQWGMRLGDVLIRMNKISEDQLRQQLSRQNRLRQLALAAALALGPWIGACPASENNDGTWSFDVIISSVDTADWQFQTTLPPEGLTTDSVAPLDDRQAERAQWLSMERPVPTYQAWVELLKGHWATSVSDGEGARLSWHAKVKAHEMMVQVKYRF